MRLLSTDNYIEFECIGGECPISCCGGDWGIPIDDTSIKYYMSVEGEFGERLRNGIVQMNNTNMFRLDEKTRDCVFLNENKLCSIYKELGPNALCETCKAYPRMMYDAGDVTFCYLTNSCPEVNRMIMQRTDHMSTLFDDSEDESNHIYEYDIEGFNEALRVFAVGMHLIQNREISLGERLYLMLFYVDRFQQLVINGEDTDGLIDVFSKPEIYTLFLEKRVISDNKYIEIIHVFLTMYKSLMSDSYEHPMWYSCRKLAEDMIIKGMPDSNLVKNAFLCTEDEDIANELEQLMVYRYFAVFMQGFTNTDYLDKLAYEIIMYATLKAYIALTGLCGEHTCTQEDRIIFYSLCGRIDHTIKQKEKLISELRQDGYFSLDKLIKLI